MALDPLVEIERIAGDNYWQLAKGRIRQGEPLFGAAIVDPGSNKIVQVGEGSSLLSAIANLKPARERAYDD